MMNNIFVIILRYIMPLEHIDAHRADHLKFLDQQYESDIFIASGRQEPCSGGVILARADNRAALENILSQDPYFVHRLAEYQIYEFTPTKYNNAFEHVLRDTLE